MFIYKVTNHTNGKCYVGKTVQTPQHRWSKHLSRARKGSTLPFHQAIRKYGEENFSFEVLAQLHDHAALYKAEQDFIALLQTRSPNGYNLTDGGPGTFGRVYSEETRRRIGIKSSKANQGAGNGRNILSEKQIAFIRMNAERRYFTQKELAGLYKVCGATVSHVVTGRNWK